MPILGADMQAGTVVRWLKQPGEQIHRGDTIAEVDTEKGVIDVEVFDEGTLESIVVPAGEKVPVGTVIAMIRGCDGTSAITSPTAKQPPSEPAAADRLQRMRETIAAAMSRSKREIPHYYLATTIDFGAATSWIAERNASRTIDEQLLPSALLFKAAALAARDVPEINAVWDGKRVVLREAIHVGVAISLRGGGLVILALHDTAAQPLDELSLRLRDLTSRARAGHLKSSELSDATITVTSLGDRGADTVFGVIYPPQVAIVGFGRVVERPWAIDGSLVVRPVVTATLAADHRVSDGHRGGLFLAAIDRLLQHPEKL